MEHHANLHKSSIRYARISLKVNSTLSQKRKQLVKEVIENNQLISKAAKKLNLKLSTAKLIVKRYREEGSFFESKTEMVKRIEN
jgi:transposase